MSLSDPISDMLTRIRNAQIVCKKYVLVPMSKIKLSIVKILKNEGYINNFKLINTFISKLKIKIFLKYYDGYPVIETIKRVSKPSLRVYKKSNMIPLIMNGFGISIISTSLGLMTGYNAKKKNLGGEFICYVT